jgi:glycosyltransferase involved in cell wall biosynthesis
MTTISVVLPTYNRPKLLKKAVDSVLRQTYTDFELIIVDDASDIPVFEIVKKAYNDNRIEIYRNEQNKGVSYCRNLGADLAEGEFLAFIDDDDRWKEGKLQKQIDKFSDLNEEYAAIYTGNERVKDNEVLKTRIPEQSGDVYPEILEEFFIFPFTSLMIKEEPFFEIGGFDLDMNRGEDWDLIIRLSAKYKIAAIKQVLVERGFHGDNISQEKEHNYKARQAIWDKHHDRYTNTNIRNRFLSELYLEKGKLHLSNNNRKKALKFLNESLSYNFTKITLALLLIIPFGRYGLIASKMILEHFHY